MAESRPETVTVLFTDVVGSTAWRARIGEAAADTRASELDRVSRDVIASSGGTVVKSLGDGIMATFTSAVAALDSAVALQAVVRRLTVGGSDAGLRVGVSSGDMVREGDDWLGSAAIEASRLCAIADGGAVLVADATVRLSRGRAGHELRHLGPRVLRGFDKPIDVYELVAEGAGGLSLPPPLEHAAACALVGRRVELDRASSLLDRVAVGAAATMFVVGEPGIGKTRLAASIADEAAGRGFTVLYGRCDEGLAAPYQPVVEAVGPWLAAYPDAALGRLVGRSGAELTVLWPELSSRLDSSAELPGGDPESQRWRLFDAVVGLARSMADDRPVLLVVDDLQWAEPSTFLLLGHLARRAVPGVALLGTVRRGEGVVEAGALLGDLGTEGRMDVVELEGLDDGEVAELVSVHTGAQPPEVLSRALQRQTAGNPFFLSALVAVVRNETGRWTTPEELAGAGVPEGVRGVIGRRLSRLGPIVRRSLEVAAVAGLAFDERIVRGVLEIGVDESVDALDEAMAAGLVGETDPGRGEFVHALVRQAVLDGMSRTRVARLHWAIAEQLERHGGTGPTSEIAYHYAAGIDVGDAATVVRTALAAGDGAMQRLAFEEAAEHYRTALTSLDRVPPDADVRYRVLTSLAQALNLNADADRAEPLWLEAADIAHTAGDAERMFSVLVGYGYSLRFQGDRDDARLLDGLLDLLPPGDSPLRASALGWRAMALMRAGRIRPSEDSHMADDAVAMARRTEDAEALISTLRSRMWVAADGPDASGMLRDALELVALRPTPRPGPQVDRAVEVRDLARAFLRHGRRQEAEYHLAQSRAEAEAAGSPMPINNTIIIEAALATASGRFADAKRLAAEAIERAGGRTTLVVLAYAGQIVAARMEQGRVEEVITTLRGLDDLGYTLLPWRTMLAGAFADAGQPDRARAELDRLSDVGWHGLLHVYGSALSVRYLTELARRLDEPDRAELLLPQVRPWAGQMLVVVAGTSIEGASDRAIGHLLATLGRYDEADAAYVAGATMERAAGFPSLLARTEYWHARALLDRGKPGDTARAHVLLDEVLTITSELGMKLLHEQAAALAG
jgi:class 3 adenylate cyclase/tetratricopeptide (TPR) repeat protein